MKRQVVKHIIRFKHWQKSWDSRRINIINNLLIFIGVIFIASCANEGIPSGGEKDISPPKVINSEPLNFSKNFRGNRIKISFDEFIVLKNVNSKLIVSPPLSEKPIIKLKGKTLIVDLNEELKDSTTYSFNFGDAIVDNNEGNVLNNFVFVISTGPRIDSLSISGIVENAFSRKPEEDILVMAYLNTDDSVPLTVQPLYIARSLKDGSFNIGNIKEANYKLFALKDANNNFLFDLNTESIAFLDTLITPFAQITERIDTLKLDSLGNDSIIRTVQVKNYPDSVLLELFNEADDSQYLLSFSREDKNKLLFKFNNSLKEPVQLNPLNFTYNNFIYEKNLTHDSLIVWINDSAIYNMDSLKIELTYEKTDSLGKYYFAKDTLNLTYREKSGKGKKPKAKSELKLAIFPKDNSKLDLNKKLWILASSPIANIDTTKILFTKMQDSTKVKMSYSLVQDSFNIRRYVFKAKFDESTKYNLLINDSAFTDIRGFYNDSSAAGFTTRSKDYYGKVIINISDVKGNYIVQLLNQKDKVLSERYLNKDETISFDFLNPGKYKLKCIGDVNNNNSWDSGNYAKKLQAEKTDFYTKEIKVRSNWDLEIDWNPKL